MAQTDRQEQILALVRSRGFVSIDELAGHFSVTPQTVRRDINDLCARDLLRRYHGGAGLPSSVENLAYQARQVLQGPEKQAIAELVARHIPDEASLFINIGTTTEAVARALLGHSRLKVITNNLNVARILAENEGFEIIIAGGVVRNRDGGVIGEATMDFIRQFRTDFGIIGISGIDADGTLLDYDYHEVRVAREIIAGARQVFLVADHTKFSRSPVVRLGSIADVSALFTDRAPAPEFRALMAGHGVRLYVADAAAEGAHTSSGDVAIRA
jgi:DeoR family glycerol-3-phosphate regulon repressor